MKIEHVAIWTKDLIRLKAFYECYFGAKSNSRYTNSRKQFQSYFLTFESGSRLELMQRPNIKDSEKNLEDEYYGYAHLALSIGSEKEVDILTRRLLEEGYKVLDGPRRTGDGYYESVVLDPDGNRLEITA